MLAMPNKKQSGSEAVNQPGNGKGATVSTSCPDDGKGIGQSRNNSKNKQRSAKAAKNKSRDTDKKPDKVMTAAAKTVVAQSQRLPYNDTCTRKLTLTPARMNAHSR